MPTIPDSGAWVAALRQAMVSDRSRARARNTRPWTDDTPHEHGGFTGVIKRVCNGCGRYLGDVSDAELVATIAHQPLPDVTGECGCTTHHVCAHCLLPPGPEPCCPEHDGTTRTISERALRTFGKETHG